MARWQPDARGRLERAALALFTQRGYESVTAAEIAAAAGLTERTFFRYFADKREVLFGGATTLPALLIDAMRGARPDASPLAVVLTGLDSFDIVFDESRWEFAKARERLIASSADLQERELNKRAALSAVVADELVQRGVGAAAASFTADLGMALFHSAFGRWLSGPPTQQFSYYVRAAVHDLREVDTALEERGHGTRRPAKTA